MPSHVSNAVMDQQPGSHAVRKSFLSEACLKKDMYFEGDRSTGEMVKSQYLSVTVWCRLGVEVS